jgi:hypothetical protein
LARVNPAHQLKAAVDRCWDKVLIAGCRQASEGKVTLQGLLNEAPIDAAYRS